jgi:hypothetical protein
MEPNNEIVISFQKQVQQIYALAEKVENKNTTAKVAFDEIKQFLHVEEINNSLEDFDEIRIEVANALCELSIMSWNKCNDMNCSLQLIDIALSIKTTNKVNEKLLADKAQLIELRDKYKDQLYCFFCKINFSEPSPNSYTKDIYLLQERSRFLNSTKVTYSLKSFEIPRCNYCKKVHEKAADNFVGFLIGGFVIGIIVGGVSVISTDLSGIWFAGGGGAIGAVVGGIIGNEIKKRQIAKAKILPRNDTTLAQHPEIKKYLKQGWTLVKPSA